MTRAKAFYRQGLISLAADSLLYNAVSTIRCLFFVTLHVESIACCGNAFYKQSDKKRGIVDTAL